MFFPSFPLPSGRVCQSHRIPQARPLSQTESLGATGKTSPGCVRETLALRAGAPREEQAAGHIQGPCPVTLPSFLSLLLDRRPRPRGDRTGKDPSAPQQAYNPAQGSPALCQCVQIHAPYLRPTLLRSDSSLLRRFLDPAP